ncbi:peptidoglycan-binding protein [Pelosinus sp. sgz500959]|uniref:peptidoglycan-binding protein n=1 Tax=Pelosinus sp. sgz500959 TaxID=3242472 RepID=UPI003672D43E
MKKVYLLVALTICMLLTSVTVFATPVDEGIKFGMRGDNVQMLQKLLSENGFYVGEVDGVFGKITLKAVKDFQSSNGLRVDGVVDKETLLYLGRASSTDFNPSRSSRSMIMNASAYSAYDPGNSHYTSNGSWLRRGLVAVDPNVIPLGTRLFIPGYGYAVADDVGGAIKGNKIDIAFDTHGEAMQFGRQKITVYILD